MTAIPIYRPYIFLRCKICGRKTDHVLIETVISERGEIKETYECQECGETKKIYELASMAGMENLAIRKLKESIETKREVVERLESKKMELEKKLREPQKKDHVELPETQEPAESQSIEKTKEPPKSKHAKKNRRFF